MATKLGVLGRIASKTVAAGRGHAAKVLKGEETLPEAAGAAVEELLSGSKVRPALKTSSKKSTAEGKISVGKRFAAEKKAPTRGKAKKS